MISLRETKIKAQFIVFLVIILGLRFCYVTADSATDALNSQKAQSQAKLDLINKQIKDYQNQIAVTQAKTSTLKNEVSIYDDQIASSQLQLEANQTKIDDTNLQIQETQKLIDQKNTEIAENKKILAGLIVELNEYDDQYALKTTIGSNNLSDFLDQIQYTQNFQDKIYQLVQKIKDLKSKLEQEQKDLGIQLNKLTELKNELQATQDSLSEQRAQKEQLLSQTKGLEKNFQKLLSNSKQDESNLEKEVADLDAQIRAKLGNKTIKAAKGVLAWPVDGVLTQGYGNTGFTSLGYTFHNGIDIAAPAASPVYAAADGTVYDTDYSDTEYGNWVAIKHNISNKGGSSQIITLYGHLKTIKVTPGQTLKQGELIGYEGNTGNTTKKLYGPERGYHVHFGVYDVEGFGVKNGAYTKIYGPYKIPYGYTYNPLDFLNN